MTPEKAYEVVKYAWRRYGEAHGDRLPKKGPDFHELTPEMIKAASKYARDSKHPGKIRFMKDIRREFRGLKKESTTMYQPDSLHEMRVLSGIRPTRPSLTEARSGITAHERAEMRAGVVYEGKLSLRDLDVVDDMGKGYKPGSKWFMQALAAFVKTGRLGGEWGGWSLTTRSGKHVKPDEVRHLVNESVDEAKRPTFKKAADAIMDYLKGQGWKVQTRNKSNFKPLKFPYASDPHGDWRIWFKKQAVYLGGDQPGASINDARSLHVDIRDVTPEQFLQYAKRWMK